MRGLSPALTVQLIMRAGEQASRLAKEYGNAWKILCGMLRG